MSAGLAGDPAPVPRDPGLQPERTRLAWLRTILAMTVAAALAVRVALLGVAEASGMLPTACAILSWLGFVVVAHRRMRAFGTPQPPRLTHRSALLAAGSVTMVAVFGAALVS
ncbi:hypothetical protein CLM62_36575 [Streptomyces sp. SA15]|uniref:DUF202 domain-containing protein n=1 Tax=Streptomyces sp. SA15 TaxID=934019 RepID=UPI000BAECF73|nr:DUF202 domain-containing protein [Streptomyces sp. SA15]PAZ11255.1 hypothetical protein CLM62_36575 [Streptomyces sp. SA15]